MTGINSKRQAALDKLFEAENELGLSYEPEAAAVIGIPTTGEYAMGYAEGFNDACKKPEQEPVAYYHPQLGFYWTKPTKITAPTIVDVEPLPLYTAPPKREWVGLTDEEASWCQAPSTIQTWKRIKAKLKEKNYG